MLKSKTIKKSKIKQKRRRIALFIITVILITIIYMLFHARDYQKIYQRNEYEIKEEFNKKLKTYAFEIKKDDKTWNFIVEHKYIKKTKLIEEIETIEKENIICIIPKSKKLNTYPECLKDNEQVSYHLLKDQLNDTIDEKYWTSLENKKNTYEKIDIRNIDQNTYYIWNYKGFYKINENNYEKIDLFEKDIYDISNITQINDILVIPDYNSQYYFNKFYLINMTNGKKTEWEFKDNIYFDGYYVGSHKDSLFYVDKKNKIEWEIVPKKKRMRKVGTETKDGRIFKNDEWEKISMTKLINEMPKFQTEEIYHYEINHGLYVTYWNTDQKKQLSSKNVKEIVATLQDKIYYIVEDSLYYYSDKTGEVLVMSYFEWNFNYKNMIFIQEN